MKRLKEDKCEGVVRVSEIGPGKPYCRIPCGLTGEMSASGVDCTGGTAGLDGAERAGAVGEGKSVVGVATGV